MNTIQDKDPFLANLLKQSTLDEPSADFTNRIMSIIAQADVPAEKLSFFAQYKFWLIAALTLVIAIVAGIFFPSFIGHQQIESLHKFFNPYINIFSKISILLKSQPIISIVVVALGGLLIIDRLFSRFFHANVQYTL
ncbi:MAG: hypothetical protein NTZ33_01445 [Bacteroidetes bacterium]|nr:hypothetical protein [Bacteroidota bacterium]